MDKTKLEKLAELKSQVNFRDSQINLLYDVLMRSNTFSYHLLHLYGLSGTGKTFTIRRFMDKFCNNNNRMSSKGGKSNDSTKYYIYLNCNEVCYSSISLLFNEILIQTKNALMPQTSNQFEQFDLDTSNSIVFREEEEAAAAEDEDLEASKMVNCSGFVQQLRKLFEASKCVSKTCLYFVFDNAESLKNFGEASSNLLLSLAKLNEYMHDFDYDQFDSPANTITICSLFITEIDWHSFISDCDLMSKTEGPRPFVCAFTDYTKEQMCVILKRTACDLVLVQDMFNNDDGGEDMQMSQKCKNLNIEFYSKIILDVFYSICKDLNEIQYLIQIYYDQLMSSSSGMSDNASQLTEKGSYDKMLAVWNKMKPFLKQALTQIYLRQSMFTSTVPMSNKTSSQSEDILSKEFESLNLVPEANTSNLNTLDSTTATSGSSSNQFPKLMKFLLISAYIATHNPVKYDKKLFDYNSTNKYRKQKFTAQKFQQNEENQRAAALKTQSFDLNRLLAIFFAIISEYGLTQAINLSQIQINLKTLKSLHYLQQINSSYTLDEPKYKCLIDLETIQNISSSVTFNIKQYLAEFLSI
jgi:Cdc6-like AAA superfamily ATPase